MMKHDPHEDCPIAPDVSELVSCIRLLAAKVDTLIGHNHALMRLMLIALIALAIGKGGLDIWREIKGVSLVNPVQALK